MDISGQVVSVVGRNVNTKFGARIVYDITFADGKVAAVWNDKDGLATKAETFRQQRTSVDARLEHKPSVGNDGTQYDNYELKDIAPIGQLGQLAIPVPTNGGVAPALSTVPSTPLPIQSKEQYQREKNPEEQSRIIRQSSLATAFNFFGHMFQGTSDTASDQVIQLALDLAKTLYAEVYGQQNVAQTPEPRVINDPGSGVTVGLLGTDTPAW